MLGSTASMAVQTSVIPPSQATSARSIQNQKNGGRYGRNGDKQSSQLRKTSSSVNMSAKVCNAASQQDAVTSGQNVDERLKAARQRREQHQKLLASRELERLEREQRARKYFEQQLQQRRKKLQEQRLKEETRRAAVEEKRKQRLKEEKERHESTVRKTLEKSRRVKQNFAQKARGKNLVSRNAPRRLPLTPWEENLVGRLTTPTCSYLARSKTGQSGEVSFHSMNNSSTPIIPPHKPQQQRSGSARNRPPPSPGSNYRPPLSTGPNYRPPAAPGGNCRQQGGVKVAQAKLRHQDPNKNPNPGSPAANTRVKPAPAPKNRASPSPERTLHRFSGGHPAPQLELPPVLEEDAAVCSSALCPGNSRPIRMTGRQEKRNPPKTPSSVLAHDKTDATRTASPLRGPSPPQSPPDVCGPSSGVSDPEAASRLLSEKRREARLQREREEEERFQREEEERRSREELERRRAEERARRQAEAQRLIEEKRRREEEEQRRADEERAQAMREAILLQKQREEEQIREKTRAEEVRQEREKLAQKEEVARQARRKRLEEIMRRTRRADSPETKSAPETTSPKERQPKENETDVIPVVAFKERRSLRNLTGLEEIQTHQQAEVI
ncbi:ensconsin-like isoform X2 [Antennarius striatus]|uniref:ensconsin-like isoform X2 n=1 Tax=Antennarius striatus TaxID=241820 RepID=UPI0035B03A46